MAEVDVNISMRATGGTDAAGQVQQAETAVKNLTTSSGALEEKFQHKFQHIGLNLFAGDALRASGLGRETRQVINLMNMAMSEAGNVAGISSGGIMLIVTALAALAGIAAKVIEHQKKMGEATEKALEADDAHLKTINEKIKGLEEYSAVAGRLNKVQSDYLATLKAIGAEEAKKKNNDLIERIAFLNQAIVKEQEHIDKIDVLQSLIKGTATTYGQSTKAVEENKKKINELTLQLRAAEVEMNALHKTGTKTFEGMAADAKKSSEAIDKAHKKASEDSIKHWGDAAKENEKVMKEEAEFIGKIADQIGGDLGNAFAKSLIEGKSFTDQMKNAFKSMAEQIISDIVRMIAKWAVLTAMGFPAGGAAGGFGHMLGFATGGQVMVDKPTLFMAGEAGPEMATFTPLSGANTQSTTGSSGGGDTFNISMPITVSGVSDPDRLAQIVGPKIINQIRGAGQLNFTRGA